MLFNLIFIIMRKDFPFPCTQVHYDLVTPTPSVEFIEKDEKGCEHLCYLPVSEYIQKFPFATKTFSYEELLEAGVLVKPVDPRIYSSSDPSDGFSQQELYDAAVELKEQMSNNENVE